MNYPYANFYLEAQRAKRNLLHVFEAEPDLPVADPVRGLISGIEFDCIKELSPGMRPARGPAAS